MWRAVAASKVHYQKSILNDSTVTYYYNLSACINNEEEAILSVFSKFLIVFTISLG